MKFSTLGLKFFFWQINVSDLPRSFSIVDFLGTLPVLESPASSMNWSLFRFCVRSGVVFTPIGSVWGVSPLVSLGDGDNEGDGDFGGGTLFSDVFNDCSIGKNKVLKCQQILCKCKKIIIRQKKRQRTNQKLFLLSNNINTLILT